MLDHSTDAQDQPGGPEQRVVPGSPVAKDRPNAREMITASGSSLLPESVSRAIGPTEHHDQSAAHTEGVCQRSTGAADRYNFGGDIPDVGRISCVCEP